MEGLGDPDMDSDSESETMSPTPSLGSASLHGKKNINRGRWNKEEVRIVSIQNLQHLFLNLEKFYFVIPSEFQDEKLKRLVEVHGERWDFIANHFPDRADVQCQHRWHKVVNPELVKGKKQQKYVSCMQENSWRHNFCIVKMFNTF